MKFKVGDKVKIKDDLKDKRHYVPSMDEYRGKIAIIKVADTDSTYKLDVDCQDWWWAEEMLEEIPITYSNADTGILSDTTSTVTIKVDSIEQRLEIYEKGETNLMKILDIYKDNRIEEINQKYSKEIKEILEKDEIVKDIQKINKKIAKTDFQPISYETRMTDETRKLLNDNEAAKREEIVKIDDLVEEVTAQLELCETYEQKIQVLINYDIIDKETKKVK